MLAKDYGIEALRVILDNTPDMVYVIDMSNYEFIFINRGMDQKARRAVPGAVCYEVLHGRREPCEHCVIGKISLGENINRHYYNSKLDIWFNVGETRAKWTDGRDVLVVSSRDISEIKKKEEELKESQERDLYRMKVTQEIADNVASSALYRTRVIDGEVTLEYASSMFAQLAGLSMEELYISLRPFYANIHPDDREMFRVKLRARSVSKHEETAEFRYVLGDKTLWYKIFSRGFMQDGVIVRDGILVDITAEKLREEELIASRDKAREASKARSEFMATVNHEMRNPMNAIVGFMDLLSTDGDSIDVDTQQEYMRIVSDSANQMLKLIGDVLDISKMDASRMKLALEPVDINKLMEDLCLSFNVSDSFKDKNIELLLDTTGQDPAGEFMLDPTRLRQVLTNIIGNAIKFTDKGYVRFGYQREEGKLRFYVEDTGIGIAPDKLKDLGQPFKQVHDASLASKYGGTGLGLATSFNLVKLMGGTHRVSSTLGQGTKIEFTVALQGNPDRK